MKVIYFTIDDCSECPPQCKCEHSLGNLTKRKVSVNCPLPDAPQWKDKPDKEKIWWWNTHKKRFIFICFGCHGNDLRNWHSGESVANWEGKWCKATMPEEEL